MVKTAFVFPGQGSQSVGMLADFVPGYPIITETFAEASEAIGYDLWQLAQNGPEEKINQTEHTQVLMLTADIAISRLILQQGIPYPQAMAGHSLGEYAALVAANALSLSDGVRLVARRGQVMQNSVPLGQGAMAAIVGLTNEQVTELCNKASQGNESVSPANYNAIGQVVVAGHTPAVERLIKLAEEADARLAKIIPVSVPCHCALLTEAADLFAESLAQVSFEKPSVEVISNVDLNAYTSAEQIRNRLKEQLYSPVRWVETIQLFKNRGVELLIECGPGKVLSGLTKRIDRSLNALSVYDTISLEQLLEQLNT
ncbi:MAG: [acyl-carrier-protein] S-malonyltransferase [Legionella sp.]|nr:MAG: [acyl-carrier-protein] S-malonyltransferase [Legionella sp.]